MKNWILLCTLAVLPLAGWAQTTIPKGTTYASGQVANVSGPNTITTNGTVTVAAGAYVTYGATTTAINPGFHACPGSYFHIQNAPLPRGYINMPTSAAITFDGLGQWVAINYEIDDQTLGKHFQDTSYYKKGGGIGGVSYGIRLYSWGSGCVVWQLIEDYDYEGYGSSHDGYYIKSLQIARYIRAEGKGRWEVSTIASVRADRININGTANYSASDIAFTYNTGADPYRVTWSYDAVTFGYGTLHYSGTYDIPKQDL